MKTYVIKIEQTGELLTARLPQGYGDLSVCFGTDNPSPNQRPNERMKFNRGRDFSIRNGTLVSHNPQLKGPFVLIQIGQDAGKRCSVCRKESTGSFCSSCHTFLF